MSCRGTSSLATIQQDLLDGTVPTTRILQKCVLLANSIGSTKLVSWAKLELNGYAGVGDELPPYRKIKAQLLMDYSTPQGIWSKRSIGPEDLPDFVREEGVGNEVRLTNGLAELEAFATGIDGPSVNIALPGGDLIAKIMVRDLNDPFVDIHRVYHCVMRTAIHGVVEAVRTALADIIGEMLRVLPKDDLEPPRELADQAVHFMSTGERSTIVFNTSQASTGSTSTATLSRPEPAKDESWWKRWRNRGIAVGIATILGATATVLSWLEIAPWS
jgi:hypothetical protein